MLDLHRTRNPFVASVACLLLTAAAACGGDDDDKKPDTNAAGKGGTSAQVSAGRGGDSSLTTSGSGAITTPPPEPVACGSSMCLPPANPLTSLIPAGSGIAIPNILPPSFACCVDEASGKCGTAPAMGATCEPPAVSDVRCPGLMLSLGGLGGAGMAMSGCCIDNMCGLDGALFGRGCLENSQASSMLSTVPLIGTLARVPPPLACDRPMDKPTTPPSSDRDAGADDAGL